MGVRKAIFSIPVLARMARNGRLDGLSVFFRLVLQAIFSQVSCRHDQAWLLLESTVGFKPRECRVKGVAFALGGRASPLPTIVLIGQVILYDQYCLEESGAKGKTFVDAGANVGMFSLYAASLGAGKVYAFEPVPETFRLLKENIRKNKMDGKIIALNVALGEKNETATIRYSFAGDCGASLSMGGGKKSCKVRVTALDSIMQNKGRVDFIKIDTEGHERQVLLGARKTICRHKPALCFSAYHRPEDKTVLPRTVIGIRRDYSCRLENRSEEDFYCE